VDDKFWYPPFTFTHTPGACGAVEDAPKTSHEYLSLIKSLLLANPTVTWWVTPDGTVACTIAPV
jgi:hypothetical protein